MEWQHLIEEATCGLYYTLKYGTMVTIIHNMIPMVTALKHCCEHGICYRYQTLFIYNVKSTSL
jgi:hypothetical protein